MYMQLFTTNRNTQKLSQFSCDNMNEVFEVLIKLKPKFIKVEYYDELGLIGIGFQYFNFLQGRYISYKKIPNLKR